MMTGPALQKVGGDNQGRLILWKLVLHCKGLKQPAYSMTYMQFKGTINVSSVHVCRLKTGQATQESLTCEMLTCPFPSYDLSVSK